MLKLGLIGKGILRTQVHRLHAVLGELAGIGVTYDLMNVESEEGFDLGQALRACEAQGYTGLNITHPFKLAAFDFVTDARWLPDGLGSVNTIVFDGGVWRGDNTDLSGFIAAFRQRFRDRPPGRVLMLGAGGVGVSIAFALAGLGAEELAIYDVEPARAERLVRQVRSIDGRARTLPADWTEALADVDGLVNATPIGMHQYPGSPFPEALIGGQAWAFDAIYTPLRTEFLTAAERKGLETLGGFDLFLHQGIDAFQRFSGRTLDREQAVQAYVERYPPDSGAAP